MKTRSDFIDITGQRVGRLIVLKNVKMGRNTKFLCRCDCGKEKVINSSSLRNKTTKSCGCLNSEIVTKRNWKHGEGINGNFTKEYRAWMHMKGRCYVKTDKAFRNYGKRGIKVCDKWKNSYKNFLQDMGRCPDGYSLERINVNGDYTPENCEWIPMKDQSRNTRVNVRLTAFGETRILADWARQLGVSYGAIKYHLARNKKMEEIVTRFKSQERAIKYRPSSHEIEIYGPGA